MINTRNVRAFVLGTILIVFVGVSTYWIKSRAYEMQEYLAELEAGIEAERDRIMVLETDWSYLTRPDRIRRLSEEMLSFAPVSPQRILDLERLRDPPGAEERVEPARAGLFRITTDGGPE